jgi:hypothetical protein
MSTEEDWSENGLHVVDLAETEVTRELMNGDGYSVRATEGLLIIEE